MILDLLLSEGDKSKITTAGRRITTAWRPRATLRFDDDLADQVAGLHGGEPLGEPGRAASSDRSSAGGRWPAGRRSGRPARLFVPIVEPMTDSCRKKIRFSSAGGFGPDVAPDTTTRPPGFKRLQRVRPGGAPTVSITASTRSGSRAPDVERLVRAELERRLPAWPRCARSHTPGSRPRGPSRCTRWRRRRTRPGPARSGPGRSPDFTNSIRYAVSHAVDRQAASANESSAGLGTTLRLRHDDVLGQRALVLLGQQRAAAGRASRRRSSPSLLITEWTTTSSPVCSSTPAASQPRIIGSCPRLMPTPRSVHRSWWLRLAACTATRGPARPAARVGPLADDQRRQRSRPDRCDSA